MPTREVRVELSRRLSRSLLLVCGAMLATGGGFAVLAVSQLRGTSRDISQDLTAHAENALAAERLHRASEQIGRTTRSYLLTGDDRFLTEAAAARRSFEKHLHVVRPGRRQASSPSLTGTIERIEMEHERASARAVASYRRGDDRAIVAALLERDVQPVRDELDFELQRLADRETAAFQAARAASDAETSRAVRFLIVSATLCGLFVSAAIVGLRRLLSQLQESRVALDRVLSELEERNRDLDAFAGRIAHDLKNILAPLPLIAEQVSRGPLSSERQAPVGERLRRVSERATSIMDALLTFSRAGRPSDERAGAMVDVAVEEALESLALQRAAARADVETDVQPLCVVCSPGLLQAVLLNLVGNALKYLGDGEQRRVRVLARASGNVAELVVEDTGPGIPVEALSRIFSPFYRVPGTRAPGTGIGLATVHRIVEAHGGDIAVASRVGEGTRFVVRLPLADNPASPEPSPGTLSPRSQVLTEGQSTGPVDR